ncbi:MAG: 5'-methylthioadenosine/S-adenosylhomocysteine nucleosidase [Lactobacillaceae bacterium]|jgi:adenosylhomocysteine nucleosidase|nr:5'-methylthioadenosine/S-adenosylhomocysteine nucleosidase [Lactobacillaceae bacterium]
MKLKDCLIVIAHKDELNDDFRKLNANLVVTGVGKVNAAYHLTKKLIELKAQNRLPKYVINMGSAGSKKYKKGSLVYCYKFVQRDMDCTVFGYEKGQTPGDFLPLIIEHKKLIENLPDGVCGTGDSFVTTEEVDSRIDVVEMEAYSLAKICKLEKIDFIAIKYITDGLDETGHDDWKNEVKSSSDVMYEYLMSLTEA